LSSWGSMPAVVSDAAARLDIVVVRAETFESGTVEFFAARRVGDAYQQTGAFLEALAVEVYRSVFGHYPVYVRTGGHHARPFGQNGNNLADALVRDRRHGHDGLAALGTGSTVDEVHLPADAGVEPGAERIGAYLSGQVDLERRIDGGYLGVLGYDERVVGIAYVLHQYAGIVVDEVVDAPGAHQERGDHFALVYLLVDTVDDTCFHQRQHPVCEHFGMYAEVLVAAQLRQDGIGDGADTHLQAGAVLDELRAVAPYGAFHFVGFGEMAFDERRVVLDEKVDLRDVDERIAERARHVPVHDRDDRTGALDCREGGVHRGTEGYVAVPVGRGYLYHRHVARQHSVAARCE